MNQTYPGPQTEITNLGYEFTNQGKLFLSVKADRFRIQKKKVGIFRFGLAKEARFDNAKIKFFFSDNINPDNAAGQFDQLKKYIQNENFKPFRNETVCSVLLKPIQIEIYKNRDRVLKISASTCDLKIKKEYLEFKGSIIAQAESRRLMTEKLVLNLKTAKLIAAESYTLITPDDSFTGDQIETDIHLRST